MLSINKPELFKIIVNGVGSLHDETSMRIDEKGILFSVMSRDTTTLAIIRLHKSSFQRFDYEKVETLRFSNSIVSRIFKSCKKDDTLFISDYKEGSTISLTLSSMKTKRKYQIPLLTQEEQFKDSMPPFKHDVIVEINNSSIQELINGLVFTKDSDSILLLSNGKTIEFKEDTKTGKSVLTLKDFMSGEDLPKSEVGIGFGLLKPLIDLQSSITDKSTYHIKKDYPLMIVCKSEFIDSTVILAPRVMEETSN